MDPRTLLANADDCRSKARCYLGQPEGPFLLRLAGEFERLAGGSGGGKSPAGVSDASGTAGTQA
jgi:hypothetical protein